ncbi:MAG: cytochrome b/b6 domain-containing protein [Acetobacteraceae bacterium]|nr:cytochrome b/b6 domain-containing protein [Acetobacteraceae bacterium]
MRTDTARRPPEAGRPSRVLLVRRHAAAVRVTHWVNVLCLTVLLMSGLQIFNAHPALYLGSASDFRHPVLAIGAEKAADGQVRGVTRALGWRVDTTGVLGLSRDGAGRPWTYAFPSWATIPSWYSLADGRIWHLSFAWLFVINGLLWLAYSLASRHLWRDLVPARGELGRIGSTFVEHLRLHFPSGDAARSYNVLQKLSYLAVVLVALPLMALTGLAMSPRMDAGFPVLLDVLGGRQTARTIHFVTAFALVGFVLVHVAMVVASGAWNNLRSMVTGRYAIKRAGGEDG